MAKTAMLVMEMQNDYFWEKRLPKFNYDGEILFPAVNRAIDRFHADGCDIIYIAQVFPDTPTNQLVFGFNMEGTEGAKLHPALKVVTPWYFEKNIADVFQYDGIRAFLNANAYDSFLLCGIDLCGGILATAKGARSAGAAVTVLTDCCGTRFDAHKIAEAYAELSGCGAVLTPAFPKEA
ncbi:MAG: cysteine hydrolase [Oscillospiraceae bacterium]|nr:cysteine hydrolase [Oscillospiraceae bacterium]